MTKKQPSKKHNSKAKLNILAVISMILSLGQVITYSNMAIYYSFEEFDESLSMAVLFLIVTSINAAIALVIYKIKTKQRYNEVTVAKVLFLTVTLLAIILYAPLNIWLK